DAVAGSTPNTVRAIEIRVPPTAATRVLNTTRCQDHHEEGQSFPQGGNHCKDGAVGWSGGERNHTSCRARGPTRSRGLPRTARVAAVGVPMPPMEAIDGPRAGPALDPAGSFFLIRSSSSRT